MKPTNQEYIHKATQYSSEKYWQSSMLSLIFVSSKIGLETGFSASSGHAILFHHSSSPSIVLRVSFSLSKPRGNLFKRGHLYTFNDDSDGKMTSFLQICFRFVNPNKHSHFNLGNASGPSSPWLWEPNSSSITSLSLIWMWPKFWRYFTSQSLWGTHQSLAF